VARRAAATTKLMARVMARREDDNAVRLNRTLVGNIASFAVSNPPVKALYWCAVVAVLPVLTPVSGLSQAAVTCPGILSEQQLTTLLTGTVLEPRVLEFIKQCGIGFEVTEWVETRLRKVGATTAVVSAARAQVDQQREWRRVKFEFVKVAPGEFTMGCSVGDRQCDDAERPAHRVRITRGFEIGKYEVTQAMWESVMGSNPSHFQNFSNRPVERVTWGDIQQFLQRLNARKDGYRYRLPTEAEWEYAARAGSTGPYSGPLNRVAWYKGNSDEQTHDVGQKRPNAWGLYDVHGNVWERVLGSRRRYTPRPQIDPSASASKHLGVVRGGSWYGDPRDTRVSHRPGGVASNGRSTGVGFRLVREPALMPLRRPAGQ
jgi:formylglycine-generating enzyme required for sulfatase activity